MMTPEIFPARLAGSGIDHAVGASGRRLRPFDAPPEPELRAQFEGRDFAFFEAEPAGDDEWKIVRRVPDQNW